MKWEGVVNLGCMMRVFKVVNPILQAVDIFLQDVGKAPLPSVRVFAVIFNIQVSALTAWQISIAFLP
jgi:hypothetical protein